ARQAADAAAGTGSAALVRGGRTGMRHVVMLGTAFETRGGISSVVNVYRAHGLFQRFPVVYVATHVDGGAIRKLARCVRAWLVFGAMLTTGKVALAHVHI